MQDTQKPTIFGREPVLYLALAQAGLALIAGFGFDLTAQQIGLVMAFVAAVLGILARSQVTPVETLSSAQSREAAVTDALNRLSQASRHGGSRSGVA